MSQRCLHNIFCPVFKDHLSIKHYEVALAWPFNTSFTVIRISHLRDMNSVLDTIAVEFLQVLLALLITYFATGNLSFRYLIE